MKGLFTRSAAILVLIVLSMLTGVLCASGQEVSKVKPEELKKMIESGDMGILIVDVQPKVAYDLGHVKGAINFPWAPDLKNNGNLPKDKTLVLYCDCAHEEDSTDVAGQLKEKWQYSNVKLLEGGWGTWNKLGYPSEKK
jgi:rhodanese-related sulfurtransferase